MAVTPMSLAGFGNLRALSRRNDDPAAASRPFDRGRDGFVMGEGGAVFVLEPAATARGACGPRLRRGRRLRRQQRRPPHGHPQPRPGARRSRAMRQALADAGVDPAEVDYVNAHATSTPVGDAAEAARPREPSSATPSGRVPVSSTKSMTGHLLTAAAAVEALACLVAMQRQARPADDQPRRPRPRVRPLPRRPTRPGRTRSAWPCPTRSASAAATPAWC